MKYTEEKRQARRVKKIKKRLIRCCVYSVLLGLIFGFCIGKAAAYNEVPEVQTAVETVVEAEEPAEVVEEVKYYDCPLDHGLQDYIRTLCEENNVPMDLVIAQIQIESGFRADCISGTGDYGLMQINRINHKRFEEEYGITDFLDPYQNVFCGIKILSEHYNRYGDLDKALMAYNLGAGGAEKLWKQGIYSTSYVEKIKSASINYGSSKNE